MLMTLNVADERLTTAHRAKLAYIYVRQSSVNQVRQHQESTELQYRLVGRARSSGFYGGRLRPLESQQGLFARGNHAVRRATLIVALTRSLRLEGAIRSTAQACRRLFDFPANRCFTAATRVLPPISRGRGLLAATWDAKTLSLSGRASHPDTLSGQSHKDAHDVLGK
jgi:hypothetical protein